MTEHLDENGFLKLTALDAPIPLPGLTGDAHPPRHVIDERSIHAINAALAARRPLLIRGEPGTGKSQLAHAAAVLLGRAFIPHTVDARTDTHDLLYQIDHVARLAEAQLLGAMRFDEDDEAKMKAQRASIDLEHFVRPGPLWWAFEWTTAESCAAGSTVPERPDGWTPADGCVVLIDEIDKADSTVPNGLLDALGQGRFAVPERDDPVRMQADRPPLVVITTNEERALPDAFLRRCLVLKLALPEDAKAFDALLATRGKAHFPEADDGVLAEIARQLRVDRAQCEKDDRNPPGTAEYIDLLRVVTTLKPEHPSAQLELLKVVGEYALKKHPKKRKR